MARVKKARAKELVQPMQYRRIVFLGFLLIGGFCGLGYRLYDLQVLRHEELADRARNNTQRTFVREPRRGNIQDKKGNFLATSKTVKTVFGDPSVMGTNFPVIAKALSPILEIPEHELFDRLRPRLVINDKGQTNELKYVVLKRKVEDEDWTRITNTLAKLTFGVDETRLTPKQQAPYHRVRQKSISFEPDLMRFYPNASLAAHLLGFVGMQERTNNGIKVVETRGKDGLELTLDSVLTGVRGWRQTEMDSRRHEMVPYREQDVAPRSGLDAILTIDAGVQHIVESEIAVGMEKHTPISITAIVMRPKTGEILAMATLPNYDPNRPGDYDMAHLRNRAITDLSEPGSTFKIVAVSGALDQRLVDLNEMFDCENGVFSYLGTRLHDTHSYKNLSVEGIITKSSNIGAAKVGIRLGPQNLFNYIEAFGFGQRTRIPLPGEAPGTVHRLNRWSKISISRIPMGHEVAVTPLQMVMAMAAIANKGVLMKPMLLDRFVGENGEVAVQFQPEAVRRVISEDAAQKMVTALKTVISTNGTAIKAKLNYYTVAGKTGTARKLVNGRYVSDRHFSSFIGFFPADEPELCISVVMDEPKKGYYGGDAPAPVFARIAERAANYLAIPPEFTPRQSVASATSKERIP